MPPDANPPEPPDEVGAEDRDELGDAAEEMRRPEQPGSEERATGCAGSSPAPDEVGAEDRAPMARFRHGALGMSLGAAMTGLGNVLEGRNVEPTAIVVEHDEGEPFKERVVMRLDPDNPADSIVMIRTWIEK